MKVSIPVIDLLCEHCAVVSVPPPSASQFNIIFDVKLPSDNSENVSGSEGYNYQSVLIDIKNLVFINCGNGWYQAKASMVIVCPLCHKEHSIIKLLSIPRIFIQDMGCCELCGGKLKTIEEYISVTEYEGNPFIEISSRTVCEKCNIENLYRMPKSPLTNAEYEVDLRSHNPLPIINAPEERNPASMGKILILTALDKELAALLAALKAPFQEPVLQSKNNLSYYSFEVGNKTIICASMGMGQQNAAITVCSFISIFKIDMLLLTGICAGISKELKLGDIVISDQIVDYELAKIHDDHDSIRWEVYRTSHALLHELEAFHSTDWQDYILKMFPEQRNKITTHYGTVFSGNKVIASEKAAARISLGWDKALALEMEISGIAKALYTLEKPIPFAMIKSVCDFADSKKSDDFHEFCCHASAAYAVSFIMHCSAASIPNNENYTSENYPLNKKLLYILCDIYNTAELKCLAFKLGIDFEELAGNVKSSKAIELIQFCQRRGKLDSLICEIKKEREFVDL